ncbi:IopA [Kitasatospora sp. NPDC058201]|uniref:IopA n=1 Tax=unclassified Kitasatospora TaxID=2633591 RepID=UPI0036559867
MEAQHRLTPQIRQYEDFATGEMRWLPHVTFFNRTGYRSSTVNTDAGGFRVSHGTAGPVSLHGTVPEEPVGVVLGASPAFGFGAGGDAWTIPSLLARGPRARPWLNLAAPAFNSTQEVLLFLLHRHRLPAVRDVLVFSGLNNLVVAGLPQADDDYPQFFFSGDFFGQLGTPDLGQRLGQPGWARGRLGRVAKRLGRQDEPADGGTAVPDPAERIDTAVRHVARDLRALADLVTPLGARLHYVLQPTAAWTRKPFTAEERALIAEAGNERAGMWNLFAPVLDPAVHRAYAERLAAVSQELGVPFLDANAAIAASPAAGEWLFVDQVHLTDRGHQVTAELMRTALDL